MIKHKNYIKALEHFGVIPVYGRFKKVDKFCTKCNQYYESHEEKKTDVNIAIKIFQEAVNDNFDIAIIISGDSDLIPSIEAVKSSFPNKKFGVVIPFNRATADYKKNNRQ